MGAPGCRKSSFLHFLRKLLGTGVLPRNQFHSTLSGLHRPEFRPVSRFPYPSPGFESLGTWKERTLNLGGGL